MAVEKPDMLLIPGGRFVMGSDSGREDESPPHPVEVKSFYLARCSVTNRQYAAFLAESCATPPPFWNHSAFDDPEQPVVGVNWFEANAYCHWLGSVLGVPCRLPTEAEREYSCRAETSTDYPWGNHEEDPARIASGYGKRWGSGPEIVGGPPNGFGLCNMADNVHEWCADWYDKEYYRESHFFDPRGPETGKRRASRGGSWRHHVKVTRCSARSSLDPAYRYADYGFRIASDS